MRKQWRMGLVALAALTALSSVAYAALNAHEKAFLKEAIQGGKGEVTLGRLATRRASSSAVKRFGQRMVTDHSKANTQFEQIARKENVTVPKQLSPDMKRAEERLTKLSGPAFDRAYMTLMVRDHTADVTTFAEEIPKLKDPTLKATARKTLPVLREHLALARRTLRSVERSQTKAAAQTKGR